MINFNFLIIYWLCWNSIFSYKFYLILDAIYVFSDCRLTGPGVEYSGKKSETQSKEPCLHWIEERKFKLKHLHGDSMFSDGSREHAENYCRNPDGNTGGPWCYVETEYFGETRKLEKEYCGISFCEPRGGNFLIGRIWISSFLFFYFNKTRRPMVFLDCKKYNFLQNIHLYLSVFQLLLSLHIGKIWPNLVFLLILSFNFCPTKQNFIK